jgi:hypothetical protein
MHNKVIFTQIYIIAITFIDEQTIKRFSDVKQQQEQLERRVEQLLQYQIIEQTHQREEYEITTTKFGFVFYKTYKKKEKGRMRKKTVLILCISIFLFSQQQPAPQSKQTVHHEINIQSQSSPDSRPPRLVSPLNDAQVEEGQRFEFKVQVNF